MSLPQYNNVADIDVLNANFNVEKKTKMSAK